MSQRNEIRDALVAECEVLGIEWRDRIRGKRTHPRLLVKIDGAWRAIVYSKTTSCRRAAKNMVARLRRMNAGVA